MASLISGELSFASFNFLVVSPTPTHPQDHGNRKRIYEICAELKRRGARIEFLHYPGEHDWRAHWPRAHEAEMRAAWDDYHLVPPSRGLHEHARGEDHEIDEWADESLKAFVSWACRMRAYDVVLVNYTWMSFCLEAAPKNVFKICDTHDVFSGRRQQSWPRKTGQSDKWIFCLTAARIVVIRSANDKTGSSEPHADFQGEGGSGRDQRREDAFRTGATV